MNGERRNVFKAEDIVKENAQWTNLHRTGSGAEMRREYNKSREKGGIMLQSDK